MALFNEKSLPFTEMLNFVLFKCYVINVNAECCIRGKVTDLPPM